MKHRRDAGCGFLPAELRHAALGLHRKSVVNVRFQLANHNLGVFQGRLRGLESHPTAARQAQTTLAALACHAVGNVAAPAGVCWGAPGQLQTPRCQKGAIDYVSGWARQGCKNIFVFV